MDWYRGINEFKQGYQPRTNIIKVEKGDFKDSHSTLVRRRNHFSKQLDVHGVNDVRQIEIYAA